MGRRIWVVTLALTLTACAGEGTTPTTDRSVACQQPPVSQGASDLMMTVEPGTVAPLEVAHLAVAGAGLPAEASIGVDAMWQCWDGEAWVTTHVVYRGVGEDAGQTIPVNDSFQIHVPSIGLALDVGYPIVIPTVEAGTYRIVDRLILGEEDVEGFVLVEVVEG